MDGGEIRRRTALDGVAEQSGARVSSRFVSSRLEGAIAHLGIAFARVALDAVGKQPLNRHPPRNLRYSVSTILHRSSVRFY